MGMNMCMSMGMQGFEQNYNVAVWFDNWCPKTVGPYIGYCFLLFVLAVGVEALRALSNYLDRRFVVSFPEHQQRSFKDVFAVRFVRAVVHMLHVFVAYMVMLVVMSYNVGLFVSIMLGFGVGHFVFAPTHRPAPVYSKLPDQQTDDEVLSTHDPTACH